MEQAKNAENGNVMTMKRPAHIYEKGLDGAHAGQKTAEYWAAKARTGHNNNDP